MLEITGIGSSVNIPVGMTLGTSPSILETSDVGRLPNTLEIMLVGSSVKIPEGITPEGITPEGITPVGKSPSTLEITEVGRSPRMLDTTAEGSSVKIPVGIELGTSPRMLETSDVGRSPRTLEITFDGNKVKIAVGNWDVRPVGRLIGRSPRTLEIIDVGRGSKALEIAPEISVGNAPSEARPVRVAMTSETMLGDTTFVGRPATTDSMLEMIAPASVAWAGSSDAIVPTREVAASGRPVTMDSASEATLVAMETMSEEAAPTIDPIAEAASVGKTLLTIDTMSEGAAPTIEPIPEAASVGKTLVTPRMSVGVATTAGRVGVGSKSPVATETTLETMGVVRIGLRMVAALETMGTLS